MLVIGFQTIRNGDFIARDAEQKREESAKKLFVKGFLTSALNPKTAIFFISFLPQFIDADNKYAASTMFLYGLIFFGLGLLVLIFYAHASSIAREWIESKRKMKFYFRWITGSIFVGLGIKLMIPEHR